MKILIEWKDEEKNKRIGEFVIIFRKSYIERLKKEVKERCKNFNSLNKKEGKMREVIKLVEKQAEVIDKMIENIKEIQKEIEKLRKIWEIQKERRT